MRGTELVIFTDKINTPKDEVRRSERGLLRNQTKLKAAIQAGDEKKISQYRRSVAIWEKRLSEHRAIAERA